MGARYEIYQYVNVSCLAECLPFHVVLLSLYELYKSGTDSKLGSTKPTN